MKLYMKNIFSLLMCFALMALVATGCKEDDALSPSYAVFMENTYNVSAEAGELDVTVGWSETTWEIVTAQEEGLVTSLSVKEGGDPAAVEEYTHVIIGYSKNDTEKERRQELFVVNRTTGERSKLKIIQEPGYDSMEATLASETKYQSVFGFGGMYTVATWGTPVLTNEEITRMYSSDGLGYNILRLMIYPNESDWQKDVAGAKAAQALGATVFACPWEAPAALTEKKQINGKDVPHLKPENYARYANHLVKYVNYMKSQGVNIYAVSVQNEPDMDFMTWTPDEVVAFVKGYGQTIRNAGVKLLSPEACGFQPEYTDPVLNDAQAFAQTDIVAGHLYQGFVDLEDGYVKARHDYVAGLWGSRLASTGKTWWMTEHLFNDGEKEEDPSLWLFQTYDYCLEHLAKELHMCMEGNCSAYVYWYLKRFYGILGDTDERCPVAEGEIMKNGYFLSHYAKYAQGMTRIGITLGGTDLSATAYINDSGSEITVVFLNLQQQGYAVSLPLVKEVSDVSAIVTDEARNMESLEVAASGDRQSVRVKIPARSVVSVRLKF